MAGTIERLGPFEDALNTALGYMEQAASERHDGLWKEALWTNAELWLAEASIELGRVES